MPNVFVKEDPAKNIARDLIREQLEAILAQLAEKAPELFTKFIELMAKLYELGKGDVPVVGQIVDTGGPLNVLDEDGTGDALITATPLTEDIIKGIRNNFSDGMVRVKAAQWAAGALFAAGLFSGGLTNFVGGAVTGGGGA